MVKEPMFDARYIAGVQQAEQVVMSREVNINPLDDMNVLEGVKD